MRRHHQVGLVVAAALLLGACSSGSDPVALPPPSDSADAVAPAVAPLADQTLEGADFSAKSLEGKGVVLWFWAPWCTICRAEGPGVAKVAEELEGDVEFVGVPAFGSEAEMRDFVSDTGTTDITHVPDLTGDTWGSYGIVSQPAFVFITPSGASTSFTGALGEDDLLDAAQTQTVDES